MLPQPARGQHNRLHCSGRCEFPASQRTGQPTPPGTAADRLRTSLEVRRPTAGGSPWPVQRAPDRDASSRLDPISCCPAAALLKRAGRDALDRNAPIGARHTTCHHRSDSEPTRPGSPRLQPRPNAPALSSTAPPMASKTSQAVCPSRTAPAAEPPAKLCCLRQTGQSVTVPRKPHRRAETASRAGIVQIVPNGDARSPSGQPSAARQNGRAE